jgi:flavin-dependent dehydrogenase
MRETDVLVVGAGPAGSAAAGVLARAGIKVVLADRRQFPRDKVCGDALIPDSLHALATLGLRDRVDRSAYEAREIRIYAPDGEFVSLRAQCAALPRATLDEILLSGATETGAHFAPFLKAIGPVQSEGVVGGARFEDVRTGARLEVSARTTILATGAASDVLTRFGVCEQPNASAIAARIYVRVPPSVARAHDYLAISYPASICPGYGWIFPGPACVFNVGIGYLSDWRPQKERRNLRLLLQDFARSFPPAAHIMSAGEILTPLKGAPLRTGLCGSQLSRPGLLVVGEAAGLTFSFS